jgi:hypothetical protein
MDTTVNGGAASAVACPLALGAVEDWSELQRYRGNASAKRLAGAELIALLPLAVRRQRTFSAEPPGFLSHGILISASTIPNQKCCLIVLWGGRSLSGNGATVFSASLPTGMDDAPAPLKDQSDMAQERHTARAHMDAEAIDELLRGSPKYPRRCCLP